MGNRMRTLAYCCVLPGIGAGVAEPAHSLHGPFAVPYSPFPEFP